MVPSRTTPLHLVYDGFALEGLLYRAVASCPPVLADFLSYEALGKPYDRHRYFRGIGVSFYRSFACALEVGQRFGHGDAVASCELRRQGIVWAQTGEPEHVTVWAPSELLLACVLQCGSHEP